MDWRKIEQALIEIAKRQGGYVDTTHLGDLVLDMPVATDLNLTELAKELAERLA